MWAIDMDPHKLVLGLYQRFIVRPNRFGKDIVIECILGEPRASNHDHAQGGERNVTEKGGVEGAVEAGDTLVVECC